MHIKRSVLQFVDLVSSFLIRNFENENPLPVLKESSLGLEYFEAEDFNDHWDDLYEECRMGNYA